LSFALYETLPNGFDQVIWMVWFLAFMEFILQKMSPLVGGNLVLQIKKRWYLKF